MIKVFRNRAYLCTLTTAIFSLLQTGVGGVASAEERSNISYNISVSPIIPPSNSSSILSASSMGESLGRISHDTNSLSGLSGSRLSENHLSGRTDYKKLSGENRISRAYVKSGNNGKLKVYDGLYYMCDNCGTDTIRYRNYEITNENAKASSKTAITVKGMDAIVSGENVIVDRLILNKSSTRGVSVTDSGRLFLKSPVIKNTDIALYTSDGMLEVKDGSIAESNRGVEAIGNAVVFLESTKIKTSDGKASLYGNGGAEVWMEDGSLDFTNSHGASLTLGGKIVLKDVKITGKGKEGNSGNHAVFHTDLGGPIDVDVTTVHATNVHGILSENTVATSNSLPYSREVLKSNRISEVNIKSSHITVKGKGSYGIYFRGEFPGIENELQEEVSSEEDKNLRRVELVDLNRTMFSVEDNAIYGTRITDGIVSLTQSTLSSENLLLKAENGASLTVLAVASTLEGGAHVDDASIAKFYFGDGSEWILQQSQRGEPREPSLVNHSSVSHVSLIDNGIIKFTKLKPRQNYTPYTLNIGRGEGEVYKVQGDAHIYLNTYLNEGGELDKQKTDRVLIYGDVAGRTMVHVNSIPDSPGGYTGSGKNKEGISIIQVSGSAHENSFQLDGGYVTLAHSPYQYQLYAYGPESNLGEADSTQRLVKGEGKFWDFRLQNRYVAPQPDPFPKPELDPSPEPKPGPSPEPKPGPAPEPSPKPIPEPGIRAVVPQVPTYLLLPNALFQVGLMNIDHQSKRLESLRTVSNGLLTSEENPAFFVRGYGGSYRYVSDLTALEYGYGGELDYNAIDAGVLLQAIESTYNTASFGVMGSYEKIFLQPLDVEHSQKSSFDKWSVTAYGGVQCDAGFYVDGLFSYGLFNGDVLTRARGKTATLKGNPFSASLTTGKAFVVGDEGVIFNPQVQVIYQHLQFNKAHDIDNFDIEMGKLNQWVMRVGGSLRKTLPATEKARVVSFYSKLHLSHVLGGKQTVRFKDAFQLGAFGSSLEAGLGFNAQLSPNLALHGDLAYQHKLTTAGFSGTSFSGGLRYNF
ncbi:autotransporter outer membrane beta-barrel domain-containing protein [Bartonella doshiae]|uniref:autotransporter outer membrane beta-barrel domain-containing protein n=1 Tax=Bartonella doshiae TaxID=33044 RepID=UPI0009450AB3|nr:autotransporter outer membrane beta-barrel domain-containing protein [Bartonella doshiae]